MAEDKSAEEGNPFVIEQVKQQYIGAEGIET